ncbi:MAG: bifunctional nicotinamidase/pyrazinamidase [Pseudomonadota bacterium]
MSAKNEALIVIDMQQDFCEGGALAVAGGNALVAPINTLMAEFSTVILSQDWHPADHRSFASQHHEKGPFELAEMHYGPQVLWPDHCVQGTDGADFHPELNLHAAQLILRKGFRPEIDSYSAFFENDRTTTTGLEGYLRSHSITHLTFVGLALDYCVHYSAVDARRLGFEADVLSSHSRAIDLDGSLAAARSSMTAVGVQLV